MYPYGSRDFTAISNANAGINQNASIVQKWVDVYMSLKITVDFPIIQLYENIAVARFKNNTGHRYCWRGVVGVEHTGG